MSTRLDEKTYLTIARLSGDCRLAADETLPETLAAWGRAEPPNLVWDLSALRRIDATVFGALAGTMVMQLLRREALVWIAPPPMLLAYLEATGLQGKVQIVADENEAVQRIIVHIPKRYDSFFFHLLLEHGYLSQERLREFIDLHKRLKGESDFGLLLLAKGALTPLELLSCIGTQKCLLGEILLEEGIVEEPTLSRILKAQRLSPRRERLGDLLMRFGVASDSQIYEALARQAKRRQDLVRPTSARREADDRRSALLGEILIESNVLDREHLSLAVENQKRLGRSRRLGNILRELGFVSDSELFQALLTQFKRKRTAQRSAEDDPELRMALDELVARLDTEDHVRLHRVRRALLPMGWPAQVHLRHALRSPSSRIRRNAAWLLGDTGTAHEAEALIEALKDPDPRVIDGAGWSLVRLSGRNLPYDRPRLWMDWWTDVKSDWAERPRPVVDDDVHELETRLRPIAGGRKPDGVIIEYQVGLAEWIGGRSNMIVHGDGRVLVANVTKGSWSHHEGEIRRRQVRDLLRKLLDGSILHVRSQRPLAPADESVHDVAVSFPGELRCTVFLWYHEITRNPVFADFEKKLRTILRDVTGGKVW